jgi:adenine-specific DNA-methyltransferase
MYKSPTYAIRGVTNGTRTGIFAGNCIDLLHRMPDSCVDLTLTSPPYCMGKEYEDTKSIDDFVRAHEKILPEIVRVTRDGGSICWQVGYHVEGQRVYPLDFAVYSILSRMKDIVLRNRLVWTFGFGLNSTRRFSGRHEVVLWFTKGTSYLFDLDSVRTPQKYPGKRHYKGPSKGEYSGNPKGKNPGDVWDIPNVRACHVEKVGHPCQFPVGLADRLVRGLCPKRGIVFDPFMGSASTGVAAILNNCRFLGAEINKKYQRIACQRLQSAHAGTVPFRPADQPIYVPSDTLGITRRPQHFAEVLQ